MGVNLPFGVKWAKIINLLSIIGLIFIGLCLAAIAVPNFIKGAEEVGGSPNTAILIVVGCVAFFIGLIPAILLVFLNKALSRLHPTARIWQIILSCVGLFAFPAGTILNGITLYFMCFEEQTKKAFETKNQNK